MRVAAGWAAALLLGFAALGGATAGEADEESAASNVTETLQGQDGMRIQTMCTHCNSANVQVGGLSQELVPIRRDGYPIFGGLATSFVLSILPPDSIAEAQITKGPGDADLPAPAAGGLIRLTEARPDEIPWIDLSASLGEHQLTSATARVAGPLARWASGSLVVGGTTADPVDDDNDGWNDVSDVDRRFADGRLIMTAGREHTFDLGASWIDEENERGRGAFDSSAFRQEYLLWVLGLGPEEPPPSWTREDTAVERTEYRAGWAWRRPGADSLDVRLLDAERNQSVVSQTTADPSSIFSGFFERFKIRETDRYAALDYRRPIGLSLALQAGLETSEEKIEAATRVDAGSPSETPAVDFIESRSGSLDVDWYPSAKWNVRAGARYVGLRWGADELNIERTASELMPRASIRYSPTPAWKLRLLAGRTARAPRPIFAEVCCGQDYQRSYRADVETGATYGFEGTYQPSPDLRLNVYLSRTEFDDHLIKLAAWSMTYVQTYALANVKEARAETAEIAMRWSPVPRLRLDGSVGWSSFFNTGNEIVNMTVVAPSFTEPFPGGVSRPIRRMPYQAIRTGSLSANVNIPGGSIFSLQGNYTGPMKIQQYDPDPFGGIENGSNLVLEQLRETSDFWLINASIQVPLRHDLILIAAGDNLSDQIQNDLGDPTVDYNWGPLSGRAWRLSLRYHMDRDKL